MNGSFLKNVIVKQNPFSIAILALFLGLLTQFLWRGNEFEKDKTLEMNHSYWINDLKHLTFFNSSVFTPQDQHYYTIKKVDMTLH